MLIFKEKIECKSLTLEIDEYVPFTIKFGSNPFQVFYWRGGNGKLSLIEIGLSGETGAVSSATLISINPRDVKETDEPFNIDLPETSGIVVFDMSNWKINSKEYSSNFQDEFDSDISLIIGSDYLILTFSKADKPSCYVRNNQIRFGISQKGELSTLEVIGLTQNQVETLKQASK